MKGTVKWLMVVFGIVFWASCTQLTNFDMPEQDATVDPVEEDQADVEAEDVRVEDVRVEDIPLDDGGPVCGNNDVEPPEECDDGNLTDGDGCDADCTWTCEDNSECNDSNICNGTETCTMATHTCAAGTAMVDCDVCATDPDVSVCLVNVCEVAVCGDNCITTVIGEYCDPPNVAGCDANCHFPCDDDGDCPDNTEVCDGDEYCNPTTHLCSHQNVPAVGDVCQADPRQICIAEHCQTSQCPDGYADTGATPPEECDDGNTTPGDGCEPDCTWTCETDGECADPNVCNGDETCNTTTHLCQPGTNLPEDSDCDDTLYCNGADTCDASGGCTNHAGDPCTGGIECDNICSETADNCLSPSATACGDSGDTDCDNPDTCDGAGACAPNHEPDTTICDDGMYCNGADTCDGAGDCTHHAGDPCPGPDGDEECGESCNETDDNCTTNDPDGSICDDVQPCSMLDVCTSGACVGTTACAASPVLPAGSDHRVGICVPDADVPGITTTVNIGTSWQTPTPWTPEAMADCTGYWAYTSPALATGTEQCYKFCSDACGGTDWFYGTTQTNATCAAGHCSGDNCGFTLP